MRWTVSSWALNENKSQNIDENKSQPNSNVAKEKVKSFINFFFRTSCCGVTWNIVWFYCFWHIFNMCAHTHCNQMCARIAESNNWMLSPNEGYHCYASILIQLTIRNRIKTENIKIKHGNFRARVFDSQYLVIIVLLFVSLLAMKQIALTQIPSFSFISRRISTFIVNNTCSFARWWGIKRYVFNFILLGSLDFRSTAAAAVAEQPNKCLYTQTCIQRKFKHKLFEFKERLHTQIII